MRLRDLDPSWYVGRWRDAAGVEQHVQQDGPSDRVGMGLIFDCPVHGSGCHIAVPFSNPVDGLPPMIEGTGDERKSFWTRSGSTFDDLTLTPSIHVRDVVEVQVGGKTITQKQTHWHGFVTNGEVK